MSLVRPILLSLLFTLGCLSASANELLGCRDNWVVEQAPGGAVTFEGNTLTIKDKNGCSVWLKQKLSVPFKLSYKATIVNEGGPYDRVSDLNCFWLASDPAHPEELFFEGNKRTGIFAEYDRLQTYYVGYGGNTNTTTRFRRYAGDGSKPLLPEHDLQTRPFLLEGNHEYLIEIVADGEQIEFRRDGESIFKWKDPKPLKSGWFAFRTVLSHTRITEFKVEPLTGSSSPATATPPPRLQPDQTSR